MFVAQEVCEEALRFVDGRGDAAGGVEFHAHRQRVDEESERGTRGAPVLHAAEEKRPEHDVVAPRRVREYERPREVEERGRADSERARPLAHPRARRQVESERGLANLSGGAARAHEPERCRRLVDAGEKVAEERLVLVARDAEPRPRDEGAERLRLGERVRAAGRDRRDLVEHDLEARVIEDQVVAEQQQQPAIVRGIAGHERAHQRHARHVDPVRSRIEPFERLARDDLHGRGERLPRERSPEDVVPRDHGVERRQESVEAVAIREAEQERRQIGVAPFRHHVVEEHPLLQRRERVDVAHVRRAAGDARHDAVDLALRQVHEREHLGRDPLGVARDAVGRHVHPRRRSARGGRDPGDGRRREEIAHVDVHAAFPEPIDQRHREQRVAAEFEEVVVAARVRDGQHGGERFGDARFERALRRFVDANRIGAGVRSGEGATIEFPVRRERQRVEKYERRGYHVTRQRLEQCRAQRFRRNAFACGVVRDDARIAGRVFANDRRRFANARLRRQPRFDLAEFDPVAAHLHLRVRAAQKLQQPGRCPARAVARFVEAFARGSERIGDEALRRQRRSTDVAVREPRAAEVEIAGNADAHRIEPPIQHVRTVVRQRHTDRHVRRFLRSVRHVVRRVDARFGRAVHVDDLGLRQRAAQAAHERRRERFAAEHQPYQRRMRRRRRQDRLEERRHRVDVRDRVRFQELPERRGRIRAHVGRDHDRRPRE